MAEIKLTIPNDKIDQIVSALCREGEYQAILDDGTPNPMSRNEFAKWMVIRFVKQTVQKWSRIDGIRAIESTISQNSDISIT